MSEYRELLATAARAMRYKRSEVTLFTGWEVYVDTRGVSRQWEPDKDSGDCADMCAALTICTDWTERRVICVHRGTYIYEKFADHNNDRSAAWRMAALRVAAAIGKEMG